MKIRDFEVKAAEFFLTTEKTALSIEQQLSLLEETADPSQLANTVQGLELYDVFADISVWDLKDLIYHLSAEYLRFYNMKNERFYEIVPREL